MRLISARKGRCYGYWIERELDLGQGSWEVGLAGHSWISSSDLSRLSIVAELTSESLLQERLDAVEEMSSKDGNEVAKQLAQLLVGLPDLEKGLCRIQYGSVGLPSLLFSHLALTSLLYSARQRNCVISLRHSIASRIHFPNTRLVRTSDVVQRFSMRLSSRFLSYSTQYVLLEVRLRRELPR